MVRNIYTHQGKNIFTHQVKKNSCSPGEKHPHTPWWETFTLTKVRTSSRTRWKKIMPTRWKTSSHPMVRNICIHQDDKKLHTRWKTSSPTMVRNIYIHQVKNYTPGEKTSSHTMVRNIYIHQVETISHSPSLNGKKTLSKHHIAHTPNKLLNHTSHVVSTLNNICSDTTSALAAERVWTHLSTNLTSHHQR